MRSRWFRVVWTTILVHSVVVSQSISPSSPSPPSETGTLLSTKENTNDSITAFAQWKDKLDSLTNRSASSRWRLGSSGGQHDLSSLIPPPPPRDRPRGLLVWLPTEGRYKVGGTVYKIRGDSPPAAAVTVDGGPDVEQRPTVFWSTDETAGRRNDVDETIKANMTKQLHRERIRRKQFRLMTILKEINDRIGRGPSRRPPTGRVGVQSQRDNKRAGSGSGRQPVNELRNQPPVIGRRVVGSQRRRGGCRGRNEGRPRHRQLENCRNEDHPEEELSASHSSTTSLYGHWLGQTDRIPATARRSKDGVAGNKNISRGGLWVEFDGRRSEMCSDKQNVPTVQLILHKKATTKNRRPELARRRQRRRRRRRRKRPQPSDELNAESSSIKADILLVTVYQWRQQPGRQRQNGELRLVGKTKVRRYFDGWMEIRLKRQTSVDLCQRTARRRRSILLLIQVNDHRSGQLLNACRLLRSPAPCQANNTNPHPTTSTAGDGWDVAQKTTNSSRQVSETYLEVVTEK